ncbi:hypothetical protein [Microbacterium sp. LWS13-1.2]|uniref:Uncharacterized protein n=1 Tax=Microbacterium sp. LWS13-1.2 TaxID=3135264 RepID=A0AAU6SGJ0_9MICO
MTSTPRPAGDANALRDAALKHASAALELVDIARTAGAVQWESPPGAPVERNDVAASSNDVPRPTERTATDERRLQLRAGYLGAVEALRHATIALRRAAGNIDAALVPYSAA